MNFIVEKGSRFFKVKPLTKEARELCVELQKRFIHRNFATYKKGVNTPPPAVKLYACALFDEQEFRFHINSFHIFKDLVKSKFGNNDTVTTIDKPLPECDKREIPVKKEWEIFDYQVPIVEYLTSDSPKDKFIGIQTGKGKALALNELIKTPYGWKRMGDMSVGDEIIAKDGSTTFVTGVYPQEKKQLYKVTFVDGREIECCGEHLWRVYYINTTTHKRWRVVDTLEVLRLISMPNPRVYIDLCEAQDTEDVMLPLHPYLLGVLLGDGSISTLTPTICTPDQFIIDEIKKVLPESYEIVRNKTLEEKCPIYRLVPIERKRKVNAISDSIKDLDLNNARSYNKFIPAQYLLASKQQRLDLLQGLLDTDGTVNTLESGGSISYSTVSERLAKHVQQLVWSLGGIASISSKQTSYTYLNEKKLGRPSFTVNIRYKKPSELFRLPKKKERTNDNNQYAANLKLRVKSVVPTKVEHSQCISIAHPDKLFVTTNYIVTHNTFCSLVGVSKLGYRTIIIVEGGLVTKWASDILKVLDIPAKRTMCVRGSLQLKGLISLAKTREFNDIDVILLSNSTLQDWITMHETLAHEKDIDIGYGIHPEFFYEHLKIGHRLIDEVHKKFHFNFKQDLYTNTHRVTSLSATLFSYDKQLEGFYEIAYPKQDRYKAGAIDKYSKSFAVLYRANNPKLLRVKENGREEYSHNAFERSILRNKEMRNNYFSLILETLYDGYIPNYKEGNKAVIYVSSTDFATELVNYLKNHFKDKSVKRYVSTLKDPYENLLDPDIRVSTLGSGGTGHDIKGLTDNILTISIMSLQANVQVFGRTRFIKDQDTRFYFFNCLDVKAHLKYLDLKEKLMLELAKTFDILNYNNPI